MVKKTLTTKQESFLNNLHSCEGDLTKAALKAGYSPASIPSAIKSLKSEILDYAEGILAQSAPKAALKLVEVMEADAPIPQSNVKVQAAQPILDRIGLGKMDRVDVNHNISDNTGSLFILPAKKPSTVDGDYDEIPEN